MGHHGAGKNPGRSGSWRGPGSGHIQFRLKDWKRHSGWEGGLSGCAKVGIRRLLGSAGNRPHPPEWATRLAGQRELRGDGCRELDLGPGQLKGRS